MFFCRVSDERGTLEMSVVNEMPLKKEHLDPNVRARFHSVFLLTNGISAALDDILYHGFSRLDDKT